MSSTRRINMKLFELIICISASCWVSINTLSLYDLESVPYDFLNVGESAVEAYLRGRDEAALDNKPKPHGVFDFVIIGGGAAGSVLANRLTENPNWSILLLEAGRRENAIGDIPLVGPALTLTPYSWQFKAEKQNSSCLGMENQTCTLDAGKALGGSTVINNMVYTRGSPEDYNKWSRIVQNDTWGFDQVLPYFRKSENCDLGEEICGVTKYRHTGGELNVERTYSAPIMETFFKAGEELGLKRQLDYNSPGANIGITQFQTTQKNGRRFSGAHAFLKPVEKRSNLQIITGAFVVKILIDKNTKTAYGARYLHKHKLYEVRANKEVLLSAGALQSPKLLMLSGVGPKKQLEALNIEVQADLPVGENLSDHIAYPAVIFILNRNAESILSYANPIDWVKYVGGAKTTPASSTGADALGFVNTAMKNRNLSYPDTELLFVGLGTFSADFGLLTARTRQLTKKLYDHYFKPLEFKHTIAVFPINLHPKSRGIVELRSSNPLDPPRIYTNYLTEREDVETMISSIRYLKNLAKTKALQKYGAKFYTKPLYGCTDVSFDSDAYWECALRTLAITVTHYGGTCRMGALKKNQSSIGGVESGKSVVDVELKVHGVRNLRVVDASVMPVTISAHYSAPTYMVAEKASDFIKNQWKNK